MVTCQSVSLSYVTSPPSPVTCHMTGLVTYNMSPVTCQSVICRMSSVICHLSADRFGHLSEEIFRACRLVIDTGMHSLGWSQVSQRSAKHYELHIHWSYLALGACQYILNTMRVRFLFRRYAASSCLLQRL